MERPLEVAKEALQINNNSFNEANERLFNLIDRFYSEPETIIKGNDIENTKPIENIGILVYLNKEIQRTDENVVKYHSLISKLENLFFESGLSKEPASFSVSTFTGVK